MVASTDIKFYAHTNNNAPQLQNAYGSMINVLDAWLINGAFVGNVLSLIVSGRIATAVVDANHNLLTYQVIKIVGANQPELNGEHRITSIENSTTFKFELDSDLGVLSGSGITCSLLPLGWEKPFSSSNPSGGGKAAYRSKNELLPRRPFLRVVDELDPAWSASYALYAKVGIVEHMDGIDSLVGSQAPFDATNPNKNWVGSGSGSSAYNGWAKWYYRRGNELRASQSTDTSGGGVAGNSSYFIVGNSDYFFILNGHTASDTRKLAYFFGAIDSENLDFFLGSSLGYFNASYNQRPATDTPLLWGSNYYANLVSAHDASGRSVFNGSYVTSLHFNGATDFKTGVRDDISFSTPICLDVIVIEGVSNRFRGKVPLLKWLPHLKPYTNNALITDNNDVYLAVNTFSEQSDGQFVINVGALNANSK
jgi:hypothetical protein